MQEESASYVLDEVEKKTTDKKHDKIFKEILQNPKEITQFINNFIKYPLEERELEIYNPNYITKDFKYKEADIVYKIKGKNIYFLIEHQTKVDYSMAYRILNYCVEIIRSVVEGKNINNATYKYPRVIPVVLYTGDKKWKASTSFAKCQVNEKGYEQEIIDVSYQLIDVNKYEEKDLLKEKSLLGNIMALEKCKNNIEVIECLKNILEKNKQENIQELKRIVMYLYKEIEENTRNEIIKLFEESEVEENMSTISERIGREFRNERKMGIKEGLAQGRMQGLAQGIAQTIQETVERMIKMDFENETIGKVTGAKKSEIEKIRKEIER